MSIKQVFPYSSVFSSSISPTTSLFVNSANNTFDMRDSTGTNILFKVDASTNKGSYLYSSDGSTAKLIIDQTTGAQLSYGASSLTYDGSGGHYVGLLDSTNNTASATLLDLISNSVHLLTVANTASSTIRLRSQAGTGIIGLDDSTGAKLTYGSVTLTVDSFGSHVSTLLDPTSDASISFGSTSKRWSILYEGNDAVGITQTAGAIFSNNAAATSGSSNQKWSPGIQLTGHQWNGSASVAVDWIAQTRPLTGVTTAPDLVFLSRYNAGSWSEAFSFRNDYLVGGWAAILSAQNSGTLYVDSSNNGIKMTANILHLRAGGSSDVISIGAGANGSSFDMSPDSSADNSVGLGTTTLRYHHLETVVVNNRVLTIGTAQTVGTSLVNTTAATVGAQQYSPVLEFNGRGWETSGGTSKANRIGLQVRPVQGASSHPELDFYYDANGAGSFSRGAILQLQSGYTAFYGSGSEFTIGNNEGIGGSYALIDFLNSAIRFYAVGSLVTIFDVNGAHPNADNAVSWGDSSHRWSNIESVLYSNRVLAIGTAQTVGTTLVNTTTAANGAQQYSPGLELVGQGWETTGSTSQTNKWLIQTRPIQGTTTSSDLVFWRSRNGGSYTEIMTINDGGSITSSSGAFKGPSFGSVSVLTADGGGGFSAASGNLWSGNTSPEAGATQAYMSSLGKFVVASYANGTSTSTIPGFLGYNLTAAAAGAQQYSPSMSLRANGWRTGSGGASETVLFQMQTRPVQGTTHPTGQFDVLTSINGAGVTTPMTLSDTGTLTILKHLVFDGYTLDASAGALTNDILAYNGTSFVPTTSAAITATAAGPSLFAWGDSVGGGNTQTEFLDPWYQISTSSTTEVRVPIPFACTVSHLYAYSNTGYGGSGSGVIYTVMKNGSATTVTCTQAIGATTASDLVNSVSFAAGDLISLRKVGQSGISSGAQRPTCTVKITIS